MIQSQTYSINNLLITNEVLTSYINNFWNDIFTNIVTTHSGNQDKHLMLLCKVHFEGESSNESGYKTLGHLRRVNYTDKELFIDYLIQRLGILTESYITHPITKITFTYIIKNGLAINTAENLEIVDDNSTTPFNHNFNNMNLPISMDPSDYGTVILQNFVPASAGKGESCERFVVTSGTKTFQIDMYKDLGINKVQMLGTITLSWIDSIINDDINFFKREIGKSIIYFNHGEIVLKKKLLNAKPFNKTSPDKNIMSEFITFDMETVIKNKKFTPYAICAYNGTSSIKTYANLIIQDGVELIDQKDLFQRFINDLLSTFFKGKTKVLIAYAHNLSGFDGIFLLRHLLSLGKVDPLFHNGRIISIKVRLTIDNYIGKTIIFKDSMLLLPLSLRKLCISFNVQDHKGHFPFKLNDINYVGRLPHHSLWPTTTKDQYLEIYNENQGKIWNFRDEALKYCLLDCIALHQVITKFNELIFKEFSINVHKILTLSSLSMKIYQTHYMPANTIYQLLGPVEKDIRQSYTGGAVDVFIPFFTPHQIQSSSTTQSLPLLHNPAKAGDICTQTKAKIYIYDVNSLYPFVMAENPMPVGKPIAFTGDIRAIEPKAFGFFYCEITSPEYLEHPILQRRIKTPQGYRTVAGLGTWTGWIFSDEMDNAMRFGYKFTIIKGYQFEKGLPFNDYVLKMYNLRMQYPKNDPMNYIAKLLMNSLYGKTGMKPIGTLVEVFDTTDPDQIELLNGMLDAYGLSVHDFIQIDNHYVTIRDNIPQYQYTEEIDMYHGTNVNIAIASAVTAGGRMWMSNIKNNPNIKLYYTDTDSGVTDTPLPSEMVGYKLGQFKLEHEITHAVFLAPKVYAFRTVEGQEIIKVKGLSKGNTLQDSDLNLSNFVDLLVQDSSREFTQEKWFKKTLQGEVTIADVAYTLKTTSNKRMPIYMEINNQNVFVATKPYHYDDIIDNQSSASANNKKDK